MKIKIRFFASLKDVANLDYIYIELESATTSSLMNLLTIQFPELSKYENSIRIAVNSEYSTENKQLKDNDEIALIPPTSGG